MRIYTRIELLFPENSRAVWMIPGVEIIFGSSGNFSLPEMNGTENAFKVFCGRKRTYLENYDSPLSVFCDGVQCERGQRVTTQTPFTFGFGRFLFRATFLEVNEHIEFFNVSFVELSGEIVATIPVPAQGEIAFGRSDDTFLKFSRTGMSRIHGLIFRKGKDVFIRIIGKNNDLTIDGISSSEEDVSLNGRHLEMFGLNIIMN
ncbi:hypothetical protein KKF34_06785 [Myxococcota bacterium]|nr:hypothetical protein [Myxococcota bacterium]MBU1382407.1 hypothetical protein [Myxococcota bacterium]MBU1496566.1 hypothetical protein [Myxococcota bacterium]